MTFLISYNIRGLGAAPKFLALKETLVSARPFIIFIQETMHSVAASLAFFRKMFPAWHMAATEADGLSGGLVALWDPHWVEACAFKCSVGILISASIRGRPQKINLLNVYAPYRNRLPFWDNLFKSEILDIESLLIAGDLNLTLRSEECWGQCKKVDSIAGRIRMELLKRDLVDIIPEKMEPTWVNGRLGSAFIAKRIDRFILKASIIDSWGMPSSRIGNVFTSDHMPIFLDWSAPQRRLSYAFKFNRFHLLDKSFNDLIKNSWNDILQSEDAFLLTFREKVQLLRTAAKDWQIKQRKIDKKELLDINRKMEVLSSSIRLNGLSFEQKISRTALEKRRQELLLKEEALWRLKSRATWLKEGDRNTKFFHNFANARRQRNSIWSLDDGSGGLFHSQQDISREAFNFFHNQYKRRQTDPSDILWAVNVMPVMFDEKANDDFFMPIKEDELLATIKLFKSDKSPGPDGWPIEFFAHFYDLFKNDLLRMVDASRISGNINRAMAATFLALIPKKEKSSALGDFRPIALCNTLFKIISKIIAERLKKILNCFITMDQHAFLKDRLILDAMALTQECLYSIRSNNIDAAALKIDLKKAYDCVDWGFLRILLAKIGLRVQGINWIMACIENANLSVIINGIPTPFFQAERGIRQGCPLSPLLFILVINSLSAHINKAVKEAGTRPFASAGTPLFLTISSLMMFSLSLCCTNHHGSVFLSFSKDFNPRRA